MNLYNVVYSLLQSDATVTGIVAANIYPIQAPQTTDFPFVVMQAVSDIPNNSKPTTSITTGRSTMDKMRMQITSIGPDRTVIQTLTDAIRNKLDYFGQQTYQGVQIQFITFDSQVEAFDEGGGQDGVFLTYQDFFITYNR